MIGEQGSSQPLVREMDHRIDLVPGASLPNLAHYRLGPKEADILQLQMENISPCAVPVLLVPKNSDEWRMFVDSRAINHITFIYRVPIPRLEELIDELSCSCANFF